MSNENPEDEYPADFEKEDTLEPALPEGAAEAGGDDDFSGEEDFVEEDWETYDEEAYIDDGEGDGGLAERKAAFKPVDYHRRGYSFFRGRHLLPCGRKVRKSRPACHGRGQ